MPAYVLHKFMHQLRRMHFGQWPGGKNYNLINAVRWLALSITQFAYLLGNWPVTEFQAIVITKQLKKEARGLDTASTLFDKHNAHAGLGDGVESLEFCIKLCPLEGHP